jgi:hypothetical protein
MQSHFTHNLTILGGLKKVLEFSAHQGYNGNLRYAFLRNLTKISETLMCGLLGEWGIRLINVCKMGIF